MEAARACIGLSIRAERGKRYPVSLPTWKALGGQLIISPRPMGRMYLVTILGQSLSYSTNGGHTWITAKAPLVPGWGPESFNGPFMTDPQQPLVAYAATNYHGLYRTMDGGATWSAWAEGDLKPDAEISALAATTVTLGTRPPAATDQTRTLSAGSVDATVLGVSQGTGTVYAAGADGLYRSDAPPYATWRRVNSQSGITTIAPDPTNGRDLFVIADQVAFRSTDGGATLTEQDVISGTNATVRLLIWPSSPAHLGAPSQRLYALGGDDQEDVYVTTSDDGGQTWTQVSQGREDRVLTPSTPASIVPSPDGKTAILALPASHGGCFAVLPVGNAAQSCLKFPPTTAGDGGPSSIYQDPANPRRLWGDLGGFWFSANGGQSWVAVTAGLPPNPRVNALEVISGTAYALVSDDGRLYRSTTGSVWSPVTVSAFQGQKRPDSATGNQSVTTAPRALAAVWKAGYVLATTALGLWVSPVSALAGSSAPPSAGIGTWTQTRPAAPVGAHVAAVALADGAVLVLTTQSAQIFDPSRNRWTAVPAPQLHGNLLVPVLLPDGRAIVSGSANPCGSTGSFQIFDPVAQRWTHPAAIYRGLAPTAGVALADGRVLFTGSTCRSHLPQVSAAIYDPQTGTWTEAGSPSYFSDPGYTLILLNTGDVLEANPSMAGDDTYYALFTLRDKTWRTEHSPLDNRNGIVLVTLSDGTLLAIGGAQQTGGNTFPFADSYAYKAQTGAWITRAALSQPLAFAAAAVLADGRVLVAGGVSQSTTSEFAALYDPRADRWLAARPLLQPVGASVSAVGLPDPTAGAQAFALPDGRALIIGGGLTPELFDPGDRAAVAQSRTGAASPITGARYFPQTHHNLGGPFLAFYTQYGGLATFGYPRSEAFAENGRLMQYTDRFLLEMANGHVITAPLGRQLTTGRAFPPAAPVASTARRLYFTQTGHSLSGRFLTYWQQHKGAVLLGAPISEVVHEGNGDGSGRRYDVQWFANGRLEYHPELANPRYQVEIGLAGKQALQQLGWL